MFKMFITGKTMPELKAKLQEAADSIKTDEQVQQDEVAEQYENPQTKPVNTSPKGTAAEPVQTSNGLVDSRGIPWNAEIHSSSKQLNVDGSWRLRRGVDRKTAKRLEEKADQSVLFPAPTEERSKPTDAQPVVSAPAIPPVPAAPALPVAPPVVAIPPIPAAPAIEPVPVPQQVSAPAIPSQPVIAPAVPQAPPVVQPAPMGVAVHTVETFKATLPMTLANLVQQKKLNQEYIQQLCTHYQVNAIFEISRDEEKVKSLFDMLVGYGMIAKAA